MSPRPLPQRKKVQEAECGCGAQVLEALTVNGLDVTLDSGPVSAVGELAAAMAGISTYTRHVVADQVHPRTPWAIRARPAGSRPRTTVHPVHQCGTTWPALVTPIPTALEATDPDDAPPY